MSSYCQRRAKYAVIRNQKSGLVLDASEYEVKFQHFTGFSPQLWALELLDHGRFLIVNKSNGKVLDIEGGAHNGNNLITYEKHGEVNQQWHINSDNTIVSPGENLALEMYEGDCRAGNNVIASYHRHGEENQQFIFQYKY